MTNDRRRTYFLFQGLLMAVLLLLFIHHPPDPGLWGWRLGLLLSLLSGSLAFIRMAPERILFSWWLQVSLFAGDAALASLTLHWSETGSDLYTIYILILFGTALTRNLRYGVFMAAATSALYLLSAWSPARGFPDGPEFWLRLQFLWVTACLLAILSQDASQAQKAQEVQYWDRLVQIESLAALGQIAGEVAHRIKGPLTTIMVNAEILSHRFLRNPDAQRELSQIQQEAGHCKEILKSLLELGRIEEMDFTDLDLRDCVRSAVRSIEPQSRLAGVKVLVGPLPKPLRAGGDGSMLHDALLSLLQNAVDASSKGGSIRVEASTQRLGPWWLRAGRRREEHIITVTDEGAGISREHLASIFKPFFTTKGQDGSGLGLTAALRILQKHAGGVEAYSDGPGAGATFKLRLPALARQRARTRRGQA